MRRSIASNSAACRKPAGHETAIPLRRPVLLIEARRYPMHVAGLQLYMMPEGAGPEFARNLAVQAREALTPQAPFDAVREAGRP